ncbi:MAG: tetratricopeptide repeat protein [Deltaproteobacteria bacterium]
MTFSHGDYAKNPLVRDAEGIAAGLYRRALAHHPDERAYLGLGILLQKAGRPKEAAELLSEGIKKHPESRQLRECRAESLMKDFTVTSYQLSVISKNFVYIRLVDSD